MSPPPSNASPASGPARARSRFWIRWGLAAGVLAALAVYGAFLEGGPSPLQEAKETNEVDRNASEATAGDPATPEADAMPPAAFDPLYYAGSGSGRLEPEVPDDRPAIMDVTHEGTGGFVVEASDEAGATELVIQRTGAYAGTRSVNLGEVVDHYHELAIEADGDWTIEVLPLSAATRLEDGVVSGRGDDVVLIDAGGHGRFSHDGQAPVTVVEYRGPELFAGLAVVDEVGVHDGDVRITEDTEVLVITADGAWELSIG